MPYEHFVIPFLAGTFFLFAVIFFKFYSWLKTLDKKQRYFVNKNIFSFKTILAISEIVKEALIHLKIYKKNLLLGYMHMSFALGWFLLIIAGRIESSLHSGKFFNAPWMGIFFKYFATDTKDFYLKSFFTFIMDFLLLIVLTGLILALIKRFRSKILGMKKTTKHIIYDRIALTALWFIFPLRLLAESITSSIHGNGGFLTGTLGNFFSFMAVQNMELPMWWAYSLSLGIFFVFLPFSRYMHIPSEVVLIFLRQWGAQTGEQYSGYSELQINSCSRCGICIDVCQLNYAADKNNVQSVHLIRDKRYKKLTDEVVNNCLMCGRCVESCPVGLELTLIRQQLRNKKEIPGKIYYKFTDIEYEKKEGHIIYFAGCMTHLTPTIIIAMKNIFSHVGEKYWFMDEEKGICCGRPLRQQGFVQQAKNLMSKNYRIIINSGARVLLTSCPICYKSFKEEYKLDIPVYHHTEYIEKLLNEGKLKLKKRWTSVVYHDPCELGRGSQIYMAPRNILKSFVNMHTTNQEKEIALCCGGSLSNAILDLPEQIKIRDNALAELTKNEPDILVTACPLCKKSFVHGNKAVVKDIAEIVAENLITKTALSKNNVKEKIQHEIKNH